MTFSSRCGSIILEAKECLRENKGKDGTMVKSAEATQVQTPEHRSFSDAMGGGAFHPDLPRVEFAALLDIPILILDCQMIEDMPSQFGEHDALLILLEMSNDNGREQFTTITTGQVIIKRITRAKRDELLPLVGTITKEKTYYNIM